MMSAESDAITPTRAPYGSDRTPAEIPHPAYDGLDPAARYLADVLGRPHLAKRVTKKLSPELTAELADRVGQLVARAELTVDDQVTAELLDRLFASSLARIAGAAEAKLEEVRGTPDALHRERFGGGSRLG